LHWIIIVVILLCAIGYLAYIRFATLPVKVTSVGISYEEVAPLPGARNRFAARGGSYSDITVTARTRPHARCTAVINGILGAEKYADELGNVSWSCRIFGQVQIVSVVINAELGHLKSSCSMSYRNQESK